MAGGAAESVVAVADEGAVGVAASPVRAARSVARALVDVDLRIRDDGTVMIG